MMNFFETHGGTIKTDETDPGYVWMLCDRWGLPDNTQGKIGWHVFYRPLADGYIGNELVTPALAKAISEHYAARDSARQAQRRAAAEAALRARKPESESRPPDHVQRLASLYGDSEAAWEKGDERGWALLRQHGY